MNKKSPRRIPKNLEELPQKIMSPPKRLLKSESPLAKRLKKRQSSDILDSWLIKKGVINSPKFLNDKQEETNCSALKLLKTYRTKSGKNDCSKTIKEKAPHKSTDLSPLTRESTVSNKRIYDWLNKKELTPYPKIADKKGNENKPTESSSSLKNKSENLQVRETPISPKRTSKIDSSKEKVTKSCSSKSTNLDVFPSTRKLRERIPKVSKNKEELTPSHKVLDRKQTASESTSESKKSSISWLRKDKSPPRKRTLKSKKISSVDSSISQKADNKVGIKEKVTKSLKNSSKNINKKNSREKVTKTIQKSSSDKQTDLKSLFNKTANTKPPFKRYNSPDSCELPTFANILNNKSTKSKKKVTTTKREQKALFKKYGVNIPTVDEILREKESLEKDKNKIEQFIPMNDDSLEFVPFTEQEPQEKENILDCKHLMNQQLLKLFKKNMKYLSDIITGEIKNDRHNRYFDKNRVITNSLADLTYNTSTILFTFEQKEYLIELLKEAFDPEDKKTQYFFQVLLPELCLEIFMETHNMKYGVAVKYLDKQTY